MRAARMSPEARKAVASRAATLRWIKQRFGATSFDALGLPGGAMVDAGLEDLAAGRTTAESLLVSIAAPRLRREGIPIGSVESDPEDRLYEMLTRTAGDLAHARYNAHLLQALSFANACRLVRLDREQRAS